MQKIYKLDATSNYDINHFNKEYIDKGWKIKEKLVTIEDRYLILLLEKESRKEKLENINNIVNDNK